MAISSEYILEVFATETKRARFWAKIAVQEDRDVCWEWQAAFASNGYGNVRVGKRFGQAHRVAYVLTHGFLCTEDQLLHGCDNPKCCNPYHTTPGSQTANMQDMVAKGRNHSGHKLTIEQEVSLVTAFKSGALKMSEVTEEFQITPSTVRRALKRAETLNVAA